MNPSADNEPFLKGSVHFLQVNTSDSFDTVIMVCMMRLHVIQNYAASALSALTEPTSAVVTGVRVYFHEPHAVKVTTTSEAHDSLWLSVNFC